MTSTPNPAQDPKRVPPHSPLLQYYDTDTERRQYVDDLFNKTARHYNTIERIFGPALYQAFCDIKRTFDPDGIFNPGKIVDAPPLTANLRYGTNYAAAAPQTYFDYSEYGGAPLLGVKGVCIICHGASSPNAIKNAIRVAVHSAEVGLSQHIGAQFARREAEARP